METIIISPKTLLEEKQKHLPETITISGNRIVFSAKAARILNQKEKTRFVILLKGNKLFYRESPPSEDAFTLSKFSNGAYPRYAANVNGLPDMLASLKKLVKKLEVEPRKSNKGGLRFDFALGPLHEGGLWELVALPM